MSKNLRGLSERIGLETNLFGEVVRISSGKPEKKDVLLKELAYSSLVGKSTLLGASSFYDFLNSERQDKKIFICNGTACLISGKQEKLRTALLELFNEDEIGTVTCLGHCHTNHAFLYNHETFSLDELTSLNEIIKSGNHTRRLLNIATNSDNPPLISETGDIDIFYKDLSIFAGNLSGVLKEIELSYLRGRGGAGFPFYIKLKSLLDAESDQKYVVCNADEGDPGAFSDKWLLEERPHLVLFGMIMSGIITGAQTGIIYIRGEYPESVIAVKSAIKELEQRGLPGSALPGGDFSFNFHVVEGAGAYICGEETSLLNSIEGLRPEVRTRPPFPAQYGLFGKPTLLSNVETLANISYILKEGGSAFSAMGTKKSTGTKLISLDGAFLKPGICEVRMGTPLRTVLYEMGGGTKYPVKAFQIGGPLGGIVPAFKVDELKLDFESFNDSGFLLGHGGIVSIPADFPMIKYLSHLFEFTSRESCGKCFPCRIGAEKGVGLLRNAIDNGKKIDNELFSDLLETLQFGSLCALGGGLPLPVKNALQYFSAELEDFFNVKNQ
jgi:NADH:ubiquinone oxidoreductase subunit F (NADH-binding)